MRISVIIPTLNEASVIAQTIAAARASVCEVVVVDGGSSDTTLGIAASVADMVISSAAGRAKQMNAGARVATGDVMLFLHADTILPKTYARSIAGALADPHVVGGRFDVRLVPTQGLLLWATAELINLRSRLSRISTGDQAIFVRREIFAQLGGYPDIPLMEDVALSVAMKRAGQVACLRDRVETSSRRWLRHGIVRTILRMWTLRFLYACGVSPARLKRAYVDAR